VKSFFDLCEKRQSDWRKRG